MATESPRWFTSSYSNNGGECVEAAANLVASQGVVPVRDSKLDESPVLFFAAKAWESFVNTMK